LRNKRYNKRHKNYGSNGSPSWLKTLGVGIVSYILAHIAFRIGNEFLVFLNFVSWTIFAFLLYKNIFVWINNLDMSNDLIFWGARLIFGIIGGFATIFWFTSMFANAFSKNPLLTGINILVFGLVVLSGFVMFRTTRRYGHMYINR